MGIKKSLMLSDTTVKYINDVNKDESSISWSENVNNIFTEIDYLYRQLLPDLSEDQWMVILNTYSGCYLAQTVLPVRIASDIMDDNGVIDISDLEDNLRNIVETVHKLSQPQQMAIIHIVRKYWSHDAGTEPLIDVIKSL